VREEMEQAEGVRSTALSSTPVPIRFEKGSWQAWAGLVGI
jgi:hypothetical protein